MRATLTAIDWTILGAYMLGMIALGGVLASRIKHFKQYFLAGGALTTPLLICTLFSTYYGLDVTFGTSESGYYYGLSAWVWYSFPYYITIAFAALVIAPRLKRISRGEMMTISDLLGSRYGTPTRFISAIGCFIYNAPIMQLAGLTTVLAVCGIPPEIGLICAVTVCAVYTVLGGLWADVISDTVQFVLMCVSLAVAIPIALHWIGGVAALDALPQEYMDSGGGRSYWLLLAWAAASLTVLVEPSFYNRVFAARDAKAVRRALLLGMLLWAAYDWGVVLIGMIAQAAVVQGLPGFTDDLQGRESLVAVCTTVLPTGLRGLMIGGILASAMSTIDSYSLLASGNLVYDMYRAIHRGISDRALLLMTRVGVFVVIAAAAMIDLAFSRMREAWIFMTSVLVSIVLVPAMGAIFTRPERPMTPLAGLLSSAFGLCGLIAFYGVVFTFGVRDPSEESFVLHVGGKLQADGSVAGGAEIWQDSAVLFALPMSMLGFFIGRALGRPAPASGFNMERAA